MCFPQWLPRSVPTTCGLCPEASILPQVSQAPPLHTVTSEGEWTFF